MDGPKRGGTKWEEQLDVWNREMTGKLVALSLCALFFLALVTVKLKTREVLVRYSIAELKAYEDLLLERCLYLKTQVEEKTGGINLLGRAFELGIQLHLNGTEGREIPILTPVDERATLE